jgi:hypothetical protein
MWGESVRMQCAQACQKSGVAFEVVDAKEASKSILACLEMILRKHLSE